MQESKGVPKMLMSAQPQKRQLEPLAARFRTEEELLDYLEMKAVDAYDRMDGDEDAFEDIPLRNQ